MYFRCVSRGVLPLGTSSARRRVQSRPRRQMNKAEQRGEGDDSSVYARCNFFLRKELQITRAGALSPTAGAAAIYPRSPRAPGTPPRSFHAPTSTGRPRLPALPSHSQDGAETTSNAGPGDGVSHCRHIKHILCRQDCLQIN